MFDVHQFDSDPVVSVIGHPMPGKATYPSGWVCWVIASP